MHPDTINGEQRQSVQEPFLQLRDLENISKSTANHGLNRFHLSASLEYLFEGTFADLMHPNGEGAIEGSLSEELDAVTPALNQTRPNQDRLIHYLAPVKPRQISDIDHGILLFKDICESSLGKAPLDRHLPAFETGADTPSTAGVLSFRSSPGSRASTGSVAPASPFLVFMGARSRRQFM